MTDVTRNAILDRGILDRGLALGTDILIYTEKAIIVDVASTKAEAEYRYKSDFGNPDF